LWLEAEPAWEGVREYRGGVAMVEDGVGGREEGGRPRSLRWAAVRGMSDRSSVWRKRGKSARRMLIRGISWRVR
jgi:hypothetical protein